MHAECDNSNREPLLGADSPLAHPYKHSTCDGLHATISSTTPTPPLQPGSPTNLIRVSASAHDYRDLDVSETETTASLAPALSSEVLPLPNPSDIVMDVVMPPADPQTRRTRSVTANGKLKLTEDPGESGCRSKNSSVEGSSPADASPEDIEEVCTALCASLFTQKCRPRIACNT